MARKLSPSYRWSVASRVVAASAGGYVFAWLFTAALALILRDGWAMPRVDAMLSATMVGLLVYAAAAIAVFYARSATRAWIGLLIAAGSAALLLAFLYRGPRPWS
jgi:hypothetical protein